jgi:hypothetical protein
MDAALSCSFDLLQDPIMMMDQRYKAVQLKMHDFESVLFCNLFVIVPKDYSIVSMICLSSIRSVQHGGLIERINHQMH